MIPGRFDDLSWADIERLHANQRPEDRQLDYKRDPVGPRDEDKKEFLADVSALANAAGGDIVFGVEENGGVPTGVPGLTLDPDKEQQRLEQIIRDGLAPRLTGLRIRWISNTALAGNGAFVIRVPASFAAPHRVVYQKQNRFFIRTGNGKHEMDVHELRVAFTASEGLAKRIDELHQSGIELLCGDEVPFRVSKDPLAALSFIPLDSLREPRNLDLDHTNAVMPPRAVGSIDWLHALEGFYVYDVQRDRPSDGAALTRRNGQVAVVWRIGGTCEEEQVIWPNSFETNLLSAATQIARKLGTLGVDGPAIAAVSVLNARGHRLVRDPWSYGQPQASLRDRIHLPPAQIEDDLETALLAIAQGFWFAFHEQRPAGVALGAHQ